MLAVLKYAILTISELKKAMLKLEVLILAVL